MEVYKRNLEYCVRDCTLHHRKVVIVLCMLEGMCS
jgi:hypothetical protein